MSPAYLIKLLLNHFNLKRAWCGGAQLAEQLLGQIFHADVVGQECDGGPLQGRGGRGPWHIAGFPEPAVRHGKHVRNVSHTAQAREGHDGGATRVPVV